MSFFPILLLSNKVVLLVTVCATPSLFVQVIVVPAETVNDEGEKLFISIKTSFDPGLSFSHPAIKKAIKAKDKIIPFILL